MGIQYRLWFDLGHWRFGRGTAWSPFQGHQPLVEIPPWGVTCRFCFNVAVSTILEKRAIPADRTQSLDLADYLLGVHNPPL